MGKKIGIDLGTTYCCVSYVDDMGVLRIIDNAEGESTTPSVVFFDPNGGVVVGSPARQEGAFTPECLCERVKNYMGNPDYRFYANGEEYSASAVSALILKKLIADAEMAIGEEIEGAVITCPAYFGDGAKAATKFAGENVQLADGNMLKVLKILDEPTAAAIAYGDSKHEDMDKTVLIYDLGGGTFDCTVMKFDFQSGARKMITITTGGDHQLGGKDWDAALTELVIRKFCDSTGADADAMREDTDMKAWFSENIEKAKKTLSQKESATLAPAYDGNKERIEITREEFEAETKHLLDQTISLVDTMLGDKGMSMDDIDEIILVGGSTYMPQVSKRLELEYNKPVGSYEPNKAVAMGAALLANDAQVDSDPNPIKDEDTPDKIDSENDKVITLVNEKTGEVTEVVEICNKSYGLRFYSNGEEKVLNLILKDTVKPATGCSADHFTNFTLTGDPTPVSEVEILVLESNLMEAIVERGQCEEIYEPGSISFDGEVPGNHNVSVVMIVDANSMVTLELTDLDTGKTYKLNPKRKSDEANKAGMDIVKGMTLN